MMMMIDRARGVGQVIPLGSARRGGVSSPKLAATTMMMRNDEHDSHSKTRTGRSLGCNHHHDDGRPFSIKEEDFS